MAALLASAVLPAAAAVPATSMLPAYGVLPPDALPAYRLPTDRLEPNAAAAIPPGVRIDSATPETRTTPAGGARFSWPVSGSDGTPAVRHPFNPPDQPWLAGHRGVDLAAPVGTVVSAAGDGQVVFAGMVAGRPVVSVEHAAGVRTTYEPVEPTVKAGDPVFEGEQIGILAGGQSHCAPSCLHWGARTGPRRYIDPLLLLRSDVQVRLYPLQN